MKHAIEGLCVPVEYLVLGYLENNVYVASDGEGTVLVDPSCQAPALLAALDGRKLDAIFVTHYHSDHTGALAELREATGAVVYASVQDAPYVRNPRKAGTSPVPVAAPCEVDVELQDGAVVQVGGMQWRFLHTPGHSLGSGCFYLAAARAGEAPAGGEGAGAGASQAAATGAPVLFSGDTLFCGTTGRTDFKGGSVADMYDSLAKLSKLPDNVAVLPGHGAFSTIGRERATTMRKWGVG
ncbi:MAG: MBL fold metallo-hydrolase [Coriobacteriia bacterium]|nr:MBL fold metallo-hydrolase [Coriobacteriia bacterium]